MGDRFGNYVIQRLFEGGNEEVRHMIYETIVQPENLEEIKKTNFGNLLVREGFVLTKLNR